MGHSRETGWERRGQSVTVTNSTIDLDAFRAVDPVRSMADFYLLSYLGATADIAPVDEHSDALATLVTMANDKRTELVNTIVGPFATYLDMAIGGEVRHHRAIKQMSSDRMKAWGQWQSIRDQVGPQALLDAADLFGEMGTGFGGELWATAAKILHKYVTGAMPAWLFADRVFTMVHNGGSMLNKAKWAHTSPLDGRTELCQTIGAAHAAGDTDIALLMFVASADVVSLVRQWWTARNRCYVSTNRRPVVLPTLSGRLRQRGYRWVVQMPTSGGYSNEIDLVDGFRDIDESKVWSN